MALFPAYSDNSVPNLQHGDIDTYINVDVKNGSSEKYTINSSEESDLLKSENSNDSTHAPKKRKREKEKKHKSKHKRGKKVKKPKEDPPISLNEDFYIDKKLDYGNMRVSTLYNPARPSYSRVNIILGNEQILRSYKRKGKTSRYFNTKIVSEKTEDSAQTQIQTQTHIQTRQSASEKALESTEDVVNITEDFIDITESGIKWGDEKIDKELVDKTAHFNEYVQGNPYDVEMWLQFVKFQEDRLAFDVFNHRIASKATAENICYTKQLSILDSALKHNLNSLELLSKKVKLSQQCMDSDQYLSMLKQLISTSDLKVSLVTNSWFWYLDAIQCSMALCSVPSVKEIYIAAIKALSKIQKQNYPVSHIDITYRLGLFLRQSGLWEQLWMLIKLNIETNLAASNIEGSTNFEDVVSKIDLKSLMDEENKIICSGLPMHEVWSRIELIRSKLQWLPSTVESDDPQRVVFSTDFADFIKPISQKSNMFLLTVNILRLLKVPLLPCTNAIATTLKANGYLVEWEIDNIETCFSFLYSVTEDFEKVDQMKLKIMSDIFKDFVDEPNYLYTSNDYFKFVNNIMNQCSSWFEGDEQTALLVWWIRFLRMLLLTISVDPSRSSEFKQTLNNFRKYIKDMLKLHRDNNIVYKEFAIFEAHFSNSQKGVTILETCLSSLPCNKSFLRVNLSRSLVEMLLWEKSRTQSSIAKCVMILSSLSTDRKLIENDLDEDSIEQALKSFTEYTDMLLLKMSDFNRDILLTELMISDLESDWFCCHGWLVYLTQPHKVLQQFYHKIIAATHVDKLDKGCYDANRKLQIREIFLQWYISAVKSNIRTFAETSCDQIIERNFKRAIDEFPFNASLMWNYTDWYGKSSCGRLRLVKLFKNEDLSQLFAVALVLQNFIQLYKKYDVSYEDSWQPGHSNRLFNLLQAVSTHSSLKKCSLIWKMLIEFVSCHTQESVAVAKKFLYQALDECPWNKSFYQTGCTRIPSEFSELVDIMVEKQIRLHAMPEELQPIQ